MEKSKIFVHVKTLEECKELYDILKETNQKIYDSTELGLRTGIDLEDEPQLDWPYIHLTSIKNEWCGHGNKPAKKEVKIKDLKKILL